MSNPQTTKARYDLAQLFADQRIKGRFTETEVTLAWTELEKVIEASPIYKFLDGKNEK